MPSSTAAAASTIAETRFDGDVDVDGDTMRYDGYLEVNENSNTFGSDHDSDYDNGSDGESRVGEVAETNFDRLTDGSNAKAGTTLDAALNAVRLQ